MANLQCFTDKDFEDLLALMKDESDWELCNEGEVRVWRRPDKKNKVYDCLLVLCLILFFVFFFFFFFFFFLFFVLFPKALIVLRAAITVPGAHSLDPEDVMAVWRDIEYRFSWDDRCAQNLVHQLIGDDPNSQNEIGYYEGKAPPPLSNRDFVLQCGWRQRWQGASRWLYLNKSVDHPDFPENKGIVRGLSHITGVEISQEPDGSVTITYVTNGDVGERKETFWVCMLKLNSKNKVAGSQSRFRIGL
jgi:hypothetical protein